jgi:hypothetical protein
LEQDNKPRFYKIAEKRAEKLGISVKELLDHDRDAALNSKYPTPDCLDLHEVDAIVQGKTLDSDRMEHAKTCHPCATLIAVNIKTKEG